MRTLLPGQAVFDVHLSAPAAALVLVSALYMNVVLQTQTSEQLGWLQGRFRIRKRTLEGYGVAGEK